MAFTKLAENDSSVINGQRPELMAIGDSLFNGTRSLTTGGPLAPLAVPALVAKALGLPFRVPDYPRVVLFDLEEEMRQGIDIQRLRQHIIENAQAWRNQPQPWPPSGTRCFDNIAIAGTTYDSLLTATAGEGRAAIGPALDKVKANSKLDFEAVGELYAAINTAFLLNPTADPELETLSAVELMASRRPRRVMISCGSNDGLFMLGMTADPKRIPGLDEIPARAIPLADALQAHCEEVEHFYVTLLIRPRALANLAPRTNDEMFRGGGDDYFSHYIARLGALGRLTAAQMKAADDAIAEVNKKIRAIYTSRLGKRVHFIDLYDLCNRIDGKHWPGRAVRVNHRGTTWGLTNCPLASNQILGFEHGGLFSLDNMHPTTVGYNKLARWVAEEMIEREPDKRWSWNGLTEQAAFEADTLMRNLPQNITGHAFILSLLGAFFQMFSPQRRPLVSDAAVAEV